jgi:hypothetical protein
MRELCSKHDCDNVKYSSAGLCRRHNRIARRAGLAPPRKPRKPILDTIQENIAITGEGCWLWTGATGDSGYGMAYYQARTWLVHRLYWTLTRSPIPESFYIKRAACCPSQSKLCINPDHLLVTNEQRLMGDKSAITLRKIANG